MFETAVVTVSILLLLLALAIFCRKNAKLEDEYDPTEYSRAREAYMQAQRNFEQADPAYIDVAISDLGISENRVNNELRKLKITQEVEG